MTTKYVREDRPEPTEVRLPPHRPLPAQPWSLQRPRTLMLLGFGMFLVVFATGGFLRQQAGFLTTPIRGEAEVLEKFVQESGSGSVFMLRIGIKVPTGTQHFAATSLEQEFWDALQIGDRLGVIYQMSRNGKHIRVVETGILALNRKKR